MADETEVDVVEYEEIVGDLNCISSSQLNVGTLYAFPFQIPAAISNENMFTSTARSTLRSVSRSSADSSNESIAAVVTITLGGVHNANRSSAWLEDTYFPF